MEERAKQLVEELKTFEAEFEKVKKGVKAAGPRARKSLQSIRSLSAELRKDISESFKDQ